MKAQYDLFHHNSAMRKQDPNCELFYVKAKPQFITTFKMAQMQWKIENYVLAPNCIKYSTCVCLCPAEWDFCQTMHFERENAFLTRSWGRGRGRRRGDAAKGARRWVGIYRATGPWKWTIIGSKCLSGENNIQSLWLKPFFVRKISQLFPKNLSSVISLTKVNCGKLLFAAVSALGQPLLFCLSGSRKMFAWSIELLCCMILPLPVNLIL